MYDDGNTENPRTVGEAYAGAISNGSTRVGNDHTIRTSGDIVAAAGMNQYRTGMALLRLLSEWNSGAVPQTGEVPDVKELARQSALARADSGIAASEEEYGGMKVAAKRDRRVSAPVTKHDMEFAQAEHRRLQAQSTNWQIDEHKLRFQRLKTLPAIRAGLLHWVHEKGWENPEQLVADTLRHFLSPVCPACEGRKRAVIPGTSRAVGRECRKCRGTGEANLQNGGRGRALLKHILSCTARASGDLREGAHRLRRSDKSEQDRFQHRHHEKVAELQRADAEAKADEGQDAEAVAEHFKNSMGKRLPK